MLAMIMLMQHPMGQMAMGHQFHRADLFHGAAVHGFDHFAGNLRFVVVVQTFVDTGYRFYIARDDEQVVADHQDRDLPVQPGQEIEEFRLSPGIDIGGVNERKL